ncbi:MAG: hypothetical protein HOF96_03235 [Candidatus Marinimicrobia bacterium]|jgi:hypothetical protein|nr:hypothetical protein [Candidatus Neomarinimicrobiota bacterium]MBT7577835.1 hypothetical protein [Candidatus Neomarinimicrobiota bacterium]
MPDNIIFYILFLSQIILISYYYPKLIVNQMKTVLANYPPEQYPKLYPKPVEYYRMGQRIYRVVNLVILMLGAILMLAIAKWDYSSTDKISEAIPFAYWAVQIIPILIMELLGFTNFKLMRKANTKTTRYAELNPRRLFDFISPGVFTLAIVMYVACLLFFYSLHQFSFHPSNDTFVIFVTLTLMNSLFAVIIFRNMRGKKLDPHQAHADRMRQIEISTKSLFVMSIVASIFLITVEVMQGLELKFHIASLMSVYLQLTIFLGLGSILRNICIDDINFDVYRKEG